MTIQKIEEGSKVSLLISGRLDTVTAPDLETMIHKDLEDKKLLKIDMKDLEYISSAGLRVLLGAHKMMEKKDGKLIVANTNEVIDEVLEVTGFKDILNIE